ncbi:MAG: aminotransferase class V-fold PLP-dependent enzyme, partial [Actinobacteria bacterium]|nr:aminotransferase class V-fold PLP-dependent enzyme [Actinomycetota bacterium]
MGAQKKRVYLDYAATTPLDGEVLAAMEEYHRNGFGNANALYREG